MHSAGYVTGKPQTLPEYRIFLTFFKPLLYSIKKATIFHHILKNNNKVSKLIRLFIMVTVLFSPHSINSLVSLIVCLDFSEFSLDTFQGAG